MSDATQVERELAATTKRTHPSTNAEGAVAVDSFFWGTWTLNVGYIEESAQDDPVRVELQGNKEATGNDEFWHTIDAIETGTATPDKGNIAGSEAAASTQIGVGTGEEAGFEPGQPVLIHDTGTDGDSEFNYVSHTATDEINLVHGLTRAKDSGDDIYNEAERHTREVSLTGWSRVRIVVWNRATNGRDIIYNSYLVCFADIE